MRYNKLLHFMLSLFLLSFSVSLVAGIISIKSNDVINVADHQSIDVVQRSRRAALSNTEMTEILNEHNDARMLEGAANMDLMEWNTALADLALTWSNKCVYQHGQPSTSDPSTWPFNSIGQNIYAINGVTAINLTAAVDNWYGEKQYYTFSTGLCQANIDCGHYTQVVWATTFALGCAYTMCSPLSGQTSLTGTSFFLVCNYGPAGNFVGVQPYIPGAACTECLSRSFYCDNGLCSLQNQCTTSGPGCACSMPTCANGATPNAAACTCSCTTGYNGNDCSAPCVDLNSMCNPSAGQSGYIPSQCNDPKQGQEIQQLCPAMCNLCQKCSSTISCANGGTFNGDSCICSCVGGWSGNDCSSCQTVSCAFGQTFNENTCDCNSEPLSRQPTSIIYYSSLFLLGLHLIRM